MNNPIMSLGKELADLRGIFETLAKDFDRSSVMYDEFVAVYNNARANVYQSHAVKRNHLYNHIMRVNAGNRRRQARH